MPINHERSFFLTAYRGGLFRTFSSYSFNFNSVLRTRRTDCCLLRTPSPIERQAISVILEIDLLRYHRIYILFDLMQILF